MPAARVVVQHPLDVVHVANSALSTAGVRGRHVWFDEGIDVFTPHTGIQGCGLVLGTCSTQMDLHLDLHRRWRRRGLGAIYQPPASQPPANQNNVNVQHKRFGVAGIGQRGLAVAIVIGISAAMRLLILVFLFAAVNAAPLAAQVLTEGVLTGDVIDGETGEVLPGALVAATGDKGTVSTSANEEGRYRLDGLLPGGYVVHFAKDGYDFDDIAGVRVRAAATLRLDGVGTPHAVTTLPKPAASNTTKAIKVIATKPIIDVGSTQSGGTLNADITRRVPLISPGAKGGAQRGFEAAATALPQVKTDTYGASVNGATSVENQYVIDGISVNNGGFGYLGSPLSMEFVEELGVITGGYLPEYGRAMGGLMNVVTKSGGNEFTGSVFSAATPGFLEGKRLRPPTEGTVITTAQKLDLVGDIGFELGGPILRDRLFFFVGADLSTIRYRLNRDLIANGAALAGGSDHFFASQTNLQGVAKLTWLVDASHRLSFTVLATPSQGGGAGEFGIDPTTGLPEQDSLEGAQAAQSHLYRSGALDGTVKWDASLLNRRLRLDTSVGLHHEIESRLPSDGTGIGSGAGLSAVPQVEFRRSNPGPHSIRQFENVGAGVCEEGDVDNAVLCPVQTYVAGGPGFLSDATYDRIQGRHVAQYTTDAAGLHILKAGIDTSYTMYHLVQGYSGGNRYREESDGGAFDDDGLFGFMVGPDKIQTIPVYTATVTSFNIGVFAQDSWTPFDALTVNAGVRWDGEWLFSADGKPGLVMPNEWSPRFGLIIDPSSSGRMKIWGSFARYYQGIPLDIAQRSATGDPTILGVSLADVCDPTTPAGRKGCDEDSNKIVLNSVDQPDQKWFVVGAGRTAIDPNLSPPSADEITIGAEAEVFANARIGAVYTRRWLGCPWEGAEGIGDGALCSKTIEDMSRDEANTYFVGNPGFGIAKDFPVANRTYDALTLMFSKQFSDEWLAQASYTFSWLRGNYAGLFRPETDQIDPFINSDFDLTSLTVNRTGDLPFDSRHQVKGFVAREFATAYDTHFTLGATAAASEGGPTNLFGSHPLYGSDEVFILPRGSGPRLEWTFNADVHGGFTFEPIKGQSVEIGIDVFNVFDLQPIVELDETYTTADVNPLLNCKAGQEDSCSRADLDKVTQLDGTPLGQNQVNPNLGNAESYQTPRQVRFSLRWSF